MTWLIELLGDRADLGELVRAVSLSSVAVVRQDETYFLQLSDLDPEIEARAVVDKARDLLSILNGALRLGFDARESVQLGSVHRLLDGARAYFLIAEPAVLRIRGFAPTITRADGTTEAIPPGEPVRELTRLAMSDAAVANVLRLVSDGDLSWGDLYRAVEIIEENIGGLGVITDREWCTKKSIKLFKHTANSPGALGLDARHGVERTVPPAAPMGIVEARTLVLSIVHAWLREKGAGID